MSTPAAHPRLWGSGPALIVVAGNAVALLLIAVGWLAVSGAGTPVDQQSSINVGLAGLMLAGVANGTWLGAGRRSVRTLRAEVLPAPAPADEAFGHGAPTASVITSGELVSGPGLTRYHGTGCPMARGKALTSAPRGEHERSGLAACEVCRP